MLGLIYGNPVLYALYVQYVVKYDCIRMFDHINSLDLSTAFQSKKMVEHQTPTTTQVR